MAGFIDRFRGVLHALGRTEATETPAASSIGVIEMLGAIGPALLASTQATNDVQDTLKELADSYGRADLQVFVLPTLVMVEDSSTSPSETAIFPSHDGVLRLDQAGAVEHLVRRAFRERPSPQQVTEEIASIWEAAPRFGPVLTVLGHTLLSLGFGMVINPTVTALPVYAVLGVIVGVIVLIGSRAGTLSLILPVFTAFAVTVLIAWLVKPIVHDDVLRLVAPSLVSFLPGLTLTIAAVELTSGQVIAGASRLVYGIARLGLLAFGVFAGISVTGEPTTVATTPTQLGSWAPWVGIVLVSLGYYLYSAAPRRSLVWILYALVVAYSAQLLGNLVAGPVLSGLVGAAIVVPAVYLAARFRAAPPAAIMLTCAYWLLVPGAMGFIGITEAASGSAGATATILQTFGSLIAIAIGMVIGAGISRDVKAAARAWQNAEEPATADGSSSGGTTGTVSR